MYFKRIHDIRVDTDKTQQEVAEFLGIRQTVYSRYERGLRAIPLDFLIKLADYYNVSIDYLLGQTDDPCRHSLEAEEESPDN